MPSGSSGGSGGAAAGTSGVGGAGGASGAGGAGGTSGKSGSGGAGGANGSGGAVGNADTCGFVMPNPVSSGLPNPASYDTTVPGIVTDKVTGLSWQRVLTSHAGSEGCTVNITGLLYCPLRYAAAYFAGSRLGGYADWRLPTVLRALLISLTDFMQWYSSIDAEAFPDTPYEGFWSSTRMGEGRPRLRVDGLVLDRRHRDVFHRRAGARSLRPPGRRAPGALHAARGGAISSPAIRSPTRSPG